MRCYACDATGDIHDKPTGRHYCFTCMQVIIKSALAFNDEEGLTTALPDDTMFEEVLRKETGIYVHTNSPDMSQV